MSETLEESSTSDNDSFRMLSDSDSSSDIDCKDGTSSSWLDTEARKPFSNDDHTKNGFSSLCRACSSFFTGKREEEVKYKHIRFLATLKDTALRGCCLCTLINDTVDRETPNHYPAHILNLELEIGRVPSPDGEYMNLWYYYKKGSKRSKYGRFVQGIKVMNVVPCTGT